MAFIPTSKTGNAMAGAQIMTKACFYGIGVGPGDPELMTVKAVRLLGCCDVVAYPANADGGSLALKIAQPVMSANSIRLPVYVPMREGRTRALEAYDIACQNIGRHLQNERSVAYICEGDPFFYGSFAYVYARLRLEYKIEIVPGISSVMACSAVSGLPLAARNDIFQIVPATASHEKIKQALHQNCSLAIIKIGRHFEKIKSLLQEFGLQNQAMVIESATTENQHIYRVSDGHRGTLPYFSTILVYRGAEAW